MIRPQALDLPADVGSIGRHLLGYNLPRDDKDATHLVALLGLAQSADGAGQEGLRGPGRAPKDGGDVGAGPHRAKVLVPLGFVNILGLVGLEEDVGRGPHDVGLEVSGEKERPRPTHAQDVALLAPRRGEEAPLEHRRQAQDAVDRLRPEGGRGLDQIAPATAKVVEQKGLHVGRGLVLACLAGHHHREGQPATLQDRGDDRPGRGQLIAAQGPLQHLAAKGLDVR